MSSELFPHEFAADASWREERGGLNSHQTAELLHQFADGNDAALGQLVEQETPWLLARMDRRVPQYLKRRVGASDIVQATAIDLLAVRQRFENRGVNAFRNMLARMADLNLAKAIEFERAQKRDLGRELHNGSPRSAQSHRLLTALAADEATPSEWLINEELSQVVELSFRFLSESDQEMLRMREAEGLDYEQISTQLGIDPATTRRRYSRAIERLRKLVGTALRKRGESPEAPPTRPQD